MPAHRNIGAPQPKDPDSTEPTGLDWTRYLSEIAADETIDVSEWAVSPSGLTLSNASIVVGGKRTQVTMSGGTAGTRYTLTNTIQTSSGFTDERSVLVDVGNK